MMCRVTMGQIKVNISHIRVPTVYIRVNCIGHLALGFVKGNCRSLFSFSLLFYSFLFFL